jgi:hypothetical protein
MTPSAAQIDGLGRAAFALISGIAIMYGIGDAASWAIISGSVLSLITVGWTIWSNLPRQLITEVAKNPAVTEIVVDNAPLADSFPSAKVTSQ